MPSMPGLAEREPPRIAWRVGMPLAQSGEVSGVITGQAGPWGLHMEGEEPECGGGGSHDPHQRMHVSHFVSLGRASWVPYCISYACNPV